MKVDPERTGENPQPERKVQHHKFPLHNLNRTALIALGSTAICFTIFVTGATSGISGIIERNTEADRIVARAIPVSAALVSPKTWADELQNAESGIDIDAITLARANNISQVESVTLAKASLRSTVSQILDDRDNDRNNRDFNMIFFGGLGIIISTAAFLINKNNQTEAVQRSASSSRL